MNKSLLLIFSVITLSTKAQTFIYHPMLDTINIWDYSRNLFAVLHQNVLAKCSYPFGSDIMYSGTDTVINAVAYKQLYADQYQFSNPCLFGFIREDTAARQIYFLDVDGNPPILLYDFSMKIGDSIAVNSISAYYFQNGYYTLDSVGDFMTEQGIRKIFHLNCHTCPSSNTLSWVEGVGNLANSIYPYSSITHSFGPLSQCPGFPHQLEQFMICFQHNQKVFYDSCAYQAAISMGCGYFLDTCDYSGICGGYVPDIGSASAIVISPNPVHDKANAEVRDMLFANCEMKIYDVMGRLLREIKIDKSSTAINRNGLADGIYFYHINNNKGITASGKFVVE